LPSNLANLSQQTPRDRTQRIIPCPPALPQPKAPAKVRQLASECDVPFSPQPGTPSQTQESVSYEEQPLPAPHQPAVDEASLCPSPAHRLEPKASSELLHRLADKSVARAFSPPPDEPKLQQSAFKPDGLHIRNSDRPSYQPSGRSPNKIAAPPMQQNIHSHQDWLHTIAERSQHSLHQQLERLNQPSHLLAFNPEALLNQWSMPINRENVSLEALTHWSDQTITRSRNENSAAKSRLRPAPNQPSAQFSDFSPALPPTTRFTQNLEQSIPRSPTIISQPVAPPDSQPINPTPVSESSLEALQRSPTLPSLTPAQTADQPTPNLAAALVQKAKSEPAPETDLNLLATHIKRILDDEARRYGINV
jgi:hypothetical protein